MSSRIRHPSDDVMFRESQRRSASSPLIGHASIMAHRSIIPADPFASITNEDAERLRTTLAQHERRQRRGEGDASTAPLTKARALAIFRYKKERLGRLIQMLKFILFCTVYVNVLAFQRQATEGREVQHAIRGALLDVSGAAAGSFHEIDNSAQAWGWLEEVCVPALFSDTYYQGSTRSDHHRHTLGLHTVALGGFRLRQVRGVKDGSSGRCFASKYDHVQPRCLDSQESAVWLPSGGSRGPEACEGVLHPGPCGGPTDVGACHTTACGARRGAACAFDYSCDGNTGKCGFALDFGFGNKSDSGEGSRAYADELLGVLKSKRWIDQYTRSLHIDTAMYNNNHRLWARVALTIEFDLSGEVRASHEVDVLYTDPYDMLSFGIAPTHWFRALLEAICVCFVVSDSYRELRKFSGSKQSFAAYMSEQGWFNNILKGASIATNWCALVMWITFVALPTRRNLPTNPTDCTVFTDLTTLATWQRYYADANTIAVVLLTYRSVEILGVLSSGERLVYSLRKIIPQFMSFLLLVVIVMVGFAITGMALYGINDPSWSTFPAALFNIWQLNFAQYDFSAHLCGTCSVYFSSVVFSLSATILISIMIMNVFTAIVLVHWNDIDSFERERAYLRPVPQRFVEHDLRLLFHVPSSAITSAIEQMERELSEDGSDGADNFTPTQLQRLLNIAKVPANLVRQFESWLWKPLAEDGKKAEEKDKAVRQYLCRAGTLAESKDWTESREDAAKPRDWIVARLVELEGRRRLLMELLLFTVYISSYTWMTHRERSAVASHSLEELVQHQVVKLTVDKPYAWATTSDFSTIASFDHTFTWLERAFIPTVYKSEWYNGDPLDSIDLHTLGPGHTRLVGGFQLAQGRGKTHGYGCYEGRYHLLHPVCRSTDMSVANFSIGNSTTDTDTSTQTGTYSAARSSFQVGKRNRIGAADDDEAQTYLAMFPFMENGEVEALALLHTLKRHRWLDEQSANLALGLTLYNDNLKRWVSVSLRLDFTRSGGVRSSADVNVLHIDPYESRDALSIVLQLLYLVTMCLRDGAFLVGALAACCRYCGFRANPVVAVEAVDDSSVSGVYQRMINEPSFCGMNLYGNGVGWNVVNVIGSIMNTVIVGLWCYYVLLDVGELQQYGLDLGDNATYSTRASYPDLSVAAEWEQSWRAFNGFNVMIQTLRGITYFRLSETGGVLLRAGYRFMPDIMYLLPMYLMVLAGYAISGFLLFGLYSDDWATIHYSFYSMIQIQSNLYDVNKLYQYGGLAQMWVFSAQAVICVIMMNVFFAVIFSTWRELRSEHAERERMQRFGVPGGPTLDLQLLLVRQIHWRAAAAAVGRYSRDWLTEEEAQACVGEVVRDHSRLAAISRHLWATTTTQSPKVSEAPHVEPAVADDEVQPRNRTSGSNKPAADSTEAGQQFDSVDLSMPT